jgi:hypothetical protein
MVAALGRATADGHVFFGHTSSQPAGQRPVLERACGRAFAAGEKVRTQHLELPQARQTYTVLGGQAPGAWGYRHGVNEHGVAAGRTPLRTRLSSREAGLTGADLVRLVLERSRTARQAVDLLTDLVSRHGQAAGGGDEGSDSGFLIADAGEAFAVETGGRHWVCQEVCDVRALCAANTVGQDWDHIAPGLAAHAIAAGWWPGDGSKLDFARAVGACEAAEAAALRRWERATQSLGEHRGHIDTAFVRLLLADPGGRPGEETDTPEATTARLIAHLPADPRRLPLLWYRFGSPCGGVYFPVFLEGELPAAFTGAAAEAAAGSLFLPGQPQPQGVAREGLDRLQARFDQEAEEFAAEGAVLKQAGSQAEVGRQATLFMQHCLERFEEVCAGLSRARPAARGAAMSAVMNRPR